MYLASLPLTDIPEGPGSLLKNLCRPASRNQRHARPIAERFRGSDCTFPPADDPPVLQAREAAPPPVISPSRRLQTKAERPRPLTSPPLTEHSRGSDPTLYQPRAAAPTPFLTPSRQLGTKAERPSVPCIAPSDRTVQREQLCVFLRTTRVTKFRAAAPTSAASSDASSLTNAG